MPDDRTALRSPLEGKIILVIGGSTGIGASGALALSAQGARITVTSSDLELLTAFGASARGKIDVIHGDARLTEDADHAVDAVVRRYGRLDGLYHVAGGSGRRFGDGPLHEISDAGWRATLELNIDSVFRSNRAAVRQFLKQGTGGVILNTGSTLAFSPSGHHFATHAYAAAKAGIEGFTRSIASYYAPHNIRANVVCPGLTDTPMARRALTDEAILSFLKTKQPLDGGRPARPDDLDAAVIFLLSDGARFVTGQSIAVDGGWGCSDGQFGSADTQKEAAPNPPIGLDRERP